MDTPRDALLAPSQQRAPQLPAKSENAIHVPSVDEDGKEEEETTLKS